MIIRSIGNSVLVALLTLSGLACSPTAPTVERYDGREVQFSYLSNWKVTGDSPIDGNPQSRSIDLEGPNDALVTLVMGPSSSEQTLEGYASALSRARAEEFERINSAGSVGSATISEVTSQATTANVGGQQIVGVLQKFSTTVSGQKVPRQVTIFLMSSRKWKVFVTTSVASEDLKRAMPGFEVTLNSLSIKEAD